MRLLSFFPIFACALTLAAAPVPPPPDTPDVIALDGEWRFALDPDDIGTDARWFATEIKADTIPLPGTTDIARKGPPNDQRLTKQLTRRHKFVGKAWYQRDITIPESWKGRRITLTLERSKATTVWLGDTQVGPQQTRLSTPHRHLLTADATPGTHRLTLLVDNSPKLFPASGHMIDEDIQTNWNGAVGEISLRQTPPVWLEKIRVTPNIHANSAKLDITLGNATGAKQDGVIRISGLVNHGTDVVVAEPFPVFATAPFSLADGTGTFTLECEIAQPARWTEWHPELQHVDVAVYDATGALLGAREVRFAMREFSRDGPRLLCNGEPIFLRGKHDALAFPLTGAPPMDKASWLRYLGTCKNYGINHIRYHSACPPQAAFDAADELGLYVQTENPTRGAFSSGKQRRHQYQLDEAKAILDEYGNHPSHFLHTLGNELGDDSKLLIGAVATLRDYDGNRRLFASGSNNHFNRPHQQHGDDLWITMRTATDATANVRASFSHADLPLGHIETGPPNTRHDFSRALKHATIPVIGHEVGQYQVSPDFDEIPRYTGVLEARNLDIFRERLEKAGMSARWRDFFHASLELSLLCYKEDIEAALRTENFGGYQLLDLQDFQAQGTALVGILNARMEPKAPHIREKWTQFCGPVVPLLLLDKYVWNGTDEVPFTIKVSNFGPTDINGTVRLAINGKVFSEKIPCEIPKGKLSTIANTAYPNLSARPSVEAEKQTIAVTIHDEQDKEIARNTWDIWRYPEHTDADLNKALNGIRLTTHLDAAARAALDAGETVLLVTPSPPAGAVAAAPDRPLTDAEAALVIGGVADKLAPTEIKSNARRIKGLFMTDFWNYPMFKDIAERMRRKPSPGTLGIVCDPAHPIFAHFPTDSHTNWNWWHLIKNSDSVVLDGTDASFVPIVQVIDNFARNHKIGLIFECVSGKEQKGRLLVCCIDGRTLWTRPEGRQLLLSIAGYMKSEAFKPVHKLPNL